MKQNIGFFFDIINGALVITVLSMFFLITEQLFYWKYPKLLKAIIFLLYFILSVFVSRHKMIKTNNLKFWQRLLNNIVLILTMTLIQFTLFQFSDLVVNFEIMMYLVLNTAYVLVAGLVFHLSYIFIKKKVNFD